MGTILFLVQIIYIVQLIYFLSEIVTSPWIDPHQIVGKKPDIVEGSSIKQQDNLHQRKDANNHRDRNGSQSHKKDSTLNSLSCTSSRTTATSIMTD